MTDPRTNLGEGASGGPDAHPPEPLLWVRAQANCNVGGNRLERDSLYLVDPTDPFVAGLIERDHPWLIPLPGQGYGDKQVGLEAPSVEANNNLTVAVESDATPPDTVTHFDTPSISQS